ncbi:hypothetical protein KEM54_000237 [Ascosphaera aggregata]|nr:hypothetical protein KEM54_000237 [Ascosphaera aggregata]
MVAATSASKRRRVEEGMQGRIRPKKKIRKQRVYHSDSEDEEQEEGKKSLPQSVDWRPSSRVAQKTHHGSDDDEDNDDILDQEVEFSDDDEKNTTSDEKKAKLKSKSSLLVSSSEDDDDEPFLSSDSDNDADEDENENENDDPDDVLSFRKQRKPTKRNDPTAFSTSITKILSTKIPSSSRADPLLSRSRTTAEVTSSLVNEQLEKRARAKLRAQKKEELEKGHVVDVLGVDKGEAGETVEVEKKLRKIAQRGVIKLFNAVRVAQVRGEELAKEERRKRATIGMDERKKAVNEVSKQGFLELINGKGNKKISIEEA